MDSIIAAHLPDFETWQSSCLLFDELPCIRRKNNIAIYDKLLYTFCRFKEICIFENYFEIRYMINSILIICKVDGGLVRHIHFRDNFIWQDYYRLNNDKVHGKFIEYHDNGNVKIDANYKYGEPHGRSFRYDRNGVKIEESHHQMGIRIE